jgi:hypothetical protein
MTSDPNFPMSDEAQAPKPAKLPYTPPRLVTYGDVTTLTKTSASGQKADKGGAQKNRTN